MNDYKTLIEASHVFVQDAGNTILSDISFYIRSGEAWAVIGPSGSGKSTLAKVLAGQQQVSSGTLEFHLPSSSKRLLIPQQHNFRDYSSRAYYQQRFDSNYADSSPQVIETLREWSTEAAINDIAVLLNIQHILSSRLIELSNGEGKRVQLAKALLQKPEILILDNPFIGLDKEAREILHTTINHLIQQGVIVILITSSDEMPSEITHVMELRQGNIHHLYTYDAFQNRQQESSSYIHPVEEDLFSHLVIPDEYDFTIAVSMNNIRVQYGDKVILENINWTIRKGERWALKGPNGSGKSTLLSLINADNPQAYANDIILFDHPRGSGESIWDIKNKIGYVSPELHIFFQRNPSHAEAVSISSGVNDLKGYSQAGTTCFEAVASGLNDQVGSSQKITLLQSRQVDQWMQLLKVSHLKKTPLYKVSLGEQRTILLARALVKNPAMLILDEPCQGLDKEQTMQFKHLIDALCRHFHKTIIYVSHYQDDIPQSINRVLELENGRIKSISRD